MYVENKKIILILIFLLLFALLQMIILIGLEWRAPNIPYYATTTDGQIVPITPLSEPVVTSDYILQWASLAVRASFNTTFVNSQQQLSKAATYFTKEGWNRFSKMFKEHILTTVKEKKLFMSAVVDGGAVILNRTIQKGRYTWQMQLPLLITYTSASENIKKHFIVTLTVMRVPVLNISRGIAINDITVY